jgi:hypothetical protein
MNTLNKNQKEVLKKTQDLFNAMSEAQKKKNIKILISNYCRINTDEEMQIFEAFALSNNISLPQIH